MLNIAEYLPPKLRNEFLGLSAEFLKKISKYIEKISEEDITETGARLEEFKEKVAAFRQKYITEFLSYRLFEAIPKLNEAVKENQV